MAMNNNDNNNGLEHLVVGAGIGVLLVKVPATRLIAAFVAVVFGLLWAFAAFVNAWGPDGDGPNYLCMLFALGCFGIAYVFVRWYRQEVHAVQAANQAAANAYAALQTPEGIAALMQGDVVKQGPAVGYMVQVASVEPGTIRVADGEVWADVDLILSNGAAQPATFHAVVAADAWEWSAR